MVILDTDHMSVLERREQPGVGNLHARLAEVPPSVEGVHGDARVLSVMCGPAHGPDRGTPLNYSVEN